MIDVLRLLRLLLAVAVLVLALIGGWYLYQKLFGDSVRIQAVSALLAQEPSNELITGYAFVSVLHFMLKNKEVVPDHALRYDADGGKSDRQRTANDIRGMCHRLYKVAFGFPDLAKAIKAFNESGDEVVPEMLGIEAVRANTAGTFPVLRCDKLDLVESKAQRDPRQERVREQMVRDHVYDDQLLQGCTALRRMSPTKKPSNEKSETGAAPKQDAQIRSCMTAVKRHIKDFSSGRDLGREPAAERGLAQLAQPMSAQVTDLSEAMRDDWSPLNVNRHGALAVTLSTVGEVAWDGRWMLFWKTDEFHVRRDILRVVYGSDVLQVQRQPRWFGSREAYRVRLSKPEIVARDRRSVLSVSSNEKEVLKELRDSTGASRIEERIRRSSDELLEELHPMAVQLTKQYARRGLESIAETNGLALELAFD